MFVKWTDSHKLRISEEKTTMIFIGRKGKMRRNPSVKIKGVPIKCKNTLKYLGFTISNTLSWIPHIKDLKQKCALLTNSMTKTMGLNWGTPPKVLRLWYKTITERILLYGASIWGLNMTKSMCRLLNSIQRHQLLLVTKGYRTTSTASLQILAGIPPLDLQAQRESLLGRLDTKLWNRLYLTNDYELKAPSNLGHPAF
ncbi:Hypothetical protein in type-1 retrotransposable element R1DM, partial [Stegodyphus mimosarum]